MIREPVLSRRTGRECSTVLTGTDCAVVERVNPSLADGLALKRWWERADATNGYSERFKLVRRFNRPEKSFGFFDQVQLDRGPLPVMGVVEEMLYDAPGPGAQERTRAQLREFILRYFMRVSDFRQPEAYAESRRPPPPAYLRWLSWCLDDDARRGGFGYSQRFYKLCGSGRVGKFRRGEEYAIVDLRQIGATYEWVVVKVRIFDFNLTFQPLGPGSPVLVIPLQEESDLVLSRDFILNEDDPEPGVLGRYGFGYAFIQDPDDTGLLAYGPGQFRASFQLIRFEMLASGETRVRLAFVVNRPERILNVSLDPVGWAFRLADFASLGWSSRLLAPAMGLLDRLPLRALRFDPLTAYVALANQWTGGLAGRELCISKEQLEKNFLVQHYRQHYQMITGSLLTYKHVSDWLDTSSLPEWVTSGVSS